MLLNNQSFGDGSSERTLNPQGSSKSFSEWPGQSLGSERKILGPARLFLYEQGSLAPHMLTSPQRSMP